MSEGDFIDGEDDGDPFDPQNVTPAKSRAEQREAAATDVRNSLEARQRAYRRIFGGASPEDIEIVMADLRKFCRGDASAFHENERLHCLLSGRQEVYLRINQHLTLTLDELVIALS